MAYGRHRAVNHSKGDSKQGTSKEGQQRVARRREPGQAGWRRAGGVPHLLVGDGRQHQGRQVLREEGVLVGGGVATDAAVHLVARRRGRGRARGVGIVGEGQEQQPAAGRASSMQAACTPACFGSAPSDVTACPPAPSRAAGTRTESSAGRRGGSQALGWPLAGTQRRCEQTGRAL